MSGRKGSDQALLETLRADTARPSLSFAQAPTRIPSGHETEVLALRLSGGPPDFEGPLVLRAFPPTAPLDAARFEAAVHEGLRAQGFPVPRVLAFRDAEPAYLLMERLPGRGAADGVELEASATARLAGLGAALRLSLRIPEWLADVTSRLFRLDAGPVLDAFRRHGLAPERIGFPRHLDAQAARTAEPAGRGLETGLDWLRRQRPPEPPRRVLCHGDLAPNLLLERGRVTGVIDWSSRMVTLGDPAFELGNSSAMLQVPLPLPSPLSRLAAAYQRSLVRRYLAGLVLDEPVPPERVAYYRAWRRFSVLLKAAETWQACAEGAPFPERPDPWVVPPVTFAVARAFEAGTGVAVRLPNPPR